MPGTLIVFASALECNAVFPEQIRLEERTPFFSIKNHFDVAILEVGILPFATALCSLLYQNRYRTVLQMGIAGAFFESSLAIGDVVRVDTETIGDQGFQDIDGSFHPWPLRPSKENPYSGGDLMRAPSCIKALKGVRGLTVNTCTGTSTLALSRRNLFNADVESMEGASFFALCSVFGVDAYQVRAVSNYVSERNKVSWRVEEALHQLKKKVIDPMVSL